MGFRNTVVELGKKAGKAAIEKYEESKEQKEAGGIVDNLDDGSNIPVSKCNGNKRSLFIGINYKGTKAELRGCVNDVNNIKKFVVENFHFPTDSKHMVTLVDSDRRNLPTGKNIVEAMKWLVHGAKAGDSLFLHYSGHGGTVKDTSGDEVDGRDSTILPLDYQQHGQITDDMLHEILVADLPEGVRLTAIMDCCHSGSILDLPYTYKTNGKLEVEEVDNRKAALKHALGAGLRLAGGDKRGAMESGKNAFKLFLKPQGDNKAKEQQLKLRSAKADVIQFSGCRDEQTSADAKIQGQSTGAMSWSFMMAFKQGGSKHPTYISLLGNIRSLLHGKFSQTPQMSTGHRMNMNTQFLM